MKGFRGKKFNIILFWIIIVAGGTAAMVLLKPLGNLDELWNYSFAKNIAEGLVPYKDFNMVTTPFLSFLNAIFLGILNELITLRIIAIILGFFILFTSYKILRLNNINHIFSKIAILIIWVLFSEYFVLDYNMLILLIILITIYIELKYKNLNKRKEFLLGVLIGLAILTKQSVGGVLAVFFVLVKLSEISKKEEFISVFKTTFIRGLGVLTPVAIFLIYLVFNNAIIDFINYCVLGITEFSNKMPLLKLLEHDNITIRILLYTSPLIYIWAGYYIIRFKVNYEKSKKIFIMFMYSLPTLLIMYPISDTIHFTQGVLPLILMAIYMIYDEYNLNFGHCIKANKIFEKIGMFILIFLSLSLLYISAKKLYSYAQEVKDKEFNNHYSMIINSNKEGIDILNTFVLKQEELGKNVIIVDASAIFFNIPIDKYTKDFNLPLKGNLGKDGAERLIQEIENSENTIYIIEENIDGLNWQTEKEVIVFVKENLEKVDNILNYGVYEKE